MWHGNRRADCRSSNRLIKSIVLPTADWGSRVQARRPRQGPRSAVRPQLLRSSDMPPPATCDARRRRSHPTCWVTPWTVGSRPVAEVPEEPPLRVLRIERARLPRWPGIAVGQHRHDFQSDPESLFELIASPMRTTIPNTTINAPCHLVGVIERRGNRLRCHASMRSTFSSMTTPRRTSPRPRPTAMRRIV